MTAWRARWWGQGTLVDRLAVLGPDHPLVARLEREGWDNLREDLETRAWWAERMAAMAGEGPCWVYPACRECGGRGWIEVQFSRYPWDTDEVECHRCGGTGEDDEVAMRAAWDDEYGVALEGYPEGLGAAYRALRDRGLPRDEAQRLAWAEVARGDYQMEELPF